MQLAQGWIITRTVEIGLVHRVGTGTADQALRRETRTADATGPDGRPSRVEACRQ